jgi:hypothetical protein
MKRRRRSRNLVRNAAKDVAVEADDFIVVNYSRKHPLRVFPILKTMKKILPFTREQIVKIAQKYPTPYLR